MTQTLTVLGSHQFRKGMVVALGDGTRCRIERVESATTLVLRPLSLHWRLWLFLTTAPNGDATEWMRKAGRG